MKRTAICTSIMLLFMATGHIFSQSAQVERPKIGYVLSGGGAKGMAHVGVLKVLEEVGLQPDYITGTSMGSIIGGLYSIGYSADEISDIIENIDWNSVLTNQIPLNQVALPLKHEYNRYIIQMPVYDRKVELPSGVIEGEKLSQLFSGLAWRQAGVDDFNEFPVPYKCIATDLLEGEMVVMDSGDISSAMRASMAIPSVFTPVTRDTSHILVDGGVLRNFPVKEALDMGADIIIGVHVGFDTKMKPEELRSLTSVITRTSLLKGAQDVEEQMKLVDYMIIPDLEGYSTSSFSSGVKIMNLGEEAAREQIDILKALADSINAIQPPPELKMLPPNDSLYIENIKVESVSPSMALYMIAKSGLETGTWIKQEDLNEAINTLFGTLFYDRIDYYFVKENEGYELVFRIKKKPSGSLNFAVHYDNIYDAGLIVSYTHLNALKEGSRLGLTFDISGSPQFRGYYDLYMGKRRNMFLSLFGETERGPVPLVSNRIVVTNLRHFYRRAGISFGQLIGSSMMASTDFYYRYSNLKLTESMKEIYPDYEFLDQLAYIGPEWAVNYQYNTLNNNEYPRSGTRMSARFNYAFNTRESIRFSFPDSLDINVNQVDSIYNSYWHFTASSEHYIPVSKSISLIGGLAIGLAKDEKPDLDSYFVGGFPVNLRHHQIAFLGFNQNEMLTENYFKAEFGLQAELVPNLFGSIIANGIFVSDSTHQIRKQIKAFDPENYYFGVGAGLKYKTPIGPLMLQVGSGTDSWKPVFFINIGHTF